VNILNQEQKVDHNKKYWEIILGAWLQKYIAVLYDRYLSIKKYSSINKVFVAHVTEDIKDQRFSKNLPDMWKIVNYEPFWHRDDWNQHFQRYILNLIYDDNQEQNANQYERELKDLSKIKYTFLYGSNIIVDLRELVLPKRNIRVGISDDYKHLLYGQAKKDFERQLKKNSSIYQFSEKKVICYTHPDKRLRSRIFLKKDYINEFDYVFWRSLVSHFPIYYLEDYHKIYQEVLVKYPSAPLDAIFIFNDLRESISKNFYVASQVENYQAKLIGIQHGGGYGIYEPFIRELWDISVCDFFITWGWHLDRCRKTHPMPSLKNLNLSARSIAEQSRKHGILFVSTAYERYFNDIYLSPQTCTPEDSLNNIIIFLNEILNDTPYTVEWRPYTARADFGDNHVNKVINSLNPRQSAKLNIVTKDTFYSRVNSSQLFISDHCGTTFLECLAANIPTLVFWDPEWQGIRNNSVDGIKLLTEANIYHTSPHDVVAFLKMIDWDVASWWYSKEVQDRRKKFVHTFARTSDKIIIQWINLLLKEFYEW
jgi:putative transferase (TIGR04331 family)